MKFTSSVIFLFLGLTVPATAFAYVGPGAGLSLLGALWAFIVALGMALAFIIAWPVRNMLRKRRAQLSQAREEEPSERVASPHPCRPQR
jgi:hypothetical protein